MRNLKVITKNELSGLYLSSRLSSKEIAQTLGCSEGKINYWLSKYEIKKRNISDAVYQRLNPEGDPFTELPVTSSKEAFILGLGLGLFWGEGNKRNRQSVRLGNSDPALIRAFLFFLEDRYSIQRHRLRFGLQVFSDMDHDAVMKYWIKYLGVKPQQFYKTTITKSGRAGTYREKTKFGVLTLYFHNKKLRDLLLKEIDNLRGIDYSSFVLPKEERPM